MEQTSNGNKRKTDSSSASAVSNKRIRRSTTACESCRGIKSRCDIRPHESTCHRCQMLGLECKLPNREVLPQERSIIEELSKRLLAVEKQLADLTSGNRIDGVEEVEPQKHVEMVEDAVTQSTSISERPRPVETIDGLQTEYFGAAEKISAEISALGDVVGAGLVGYQTAVDLLKIFNQHYGAYTDTPPITTSQQLEEQKQHAPILVSVACLLASRFVRDFSRANVITVHRHVRRLVSTALVGESPLPFDTIEALSLLSIWRPTIQAVIHFDSWLLSGMAAAHATISFKLEKPQLSISEDCRKELRLWTRLCLTHLQYAVGHGRPLTIQSTMLDRSNYLLTFPSVPPSDTLLLSELHLYKTLSTLLSQTTPDLLQKGDFPTLNLWSQKNQPHLLAPGPPTPVQLGWWFAHLLLHRLALRHFPTCPKIHVRMCTQAANIASQFVRDDPGQGMAKPDFEIFIAAYAGLVLCESSKDRHLVENLGAYLFGLAPNGDHIAWRHACVLQRALQRRGMDGHGDGVDVSDSSSGGHVGAAGVVDGVVGVGDVQPQQLSAADGFDLCGEMLSVETLLQDGLDMQTWLGMENMVGLL